MQTHAGDSLHVIDLDHQQGVFILRMQDGENRFNLDFLAAFNAALDEVEGTEGPAALVTTGEGKFYTNGFGSLLGDERGRGPAAGIQPRDSPVPTSALDVSHGHGGGDQRTRVCRRCDRGHGPRFSCDALRSRFFLSSGGSISRFPSRPG